MNIVIEQKEKGGITKIIENEKIIYQNEYDNDIVILGDLTKYVFKEGNINYKKTDGNNITLKRDDGVSINLVNFTKKTLINAVDEKLEKSFNAFLNSIENEKYISIRLTTSNNEMRFSPLSISPNKRDGSAILFEFELDKNGNLTDISKKMLMTFIKKEFRNWFKTFMYDDSSNLFKIYYDAKTIIVSDNLRKYVKPEAEMMQDIYFKTIENSDKKRGI